MSGLHPALRAASWMGGTLVSFMTMAVAVRELSAQLGTFEILFFRSLVGFLVVLVLISRSRGKLVVTRRLGLHVLRNVAHFGGQFGWFYGIAFIPLAEVFALEFTVPFWTALLAPLLLSEKLTAARLGAVGLGVTGTLLILRPGLAAVQPAALAVLGGAVGYAFSHILTKQLTRTDPPVSILFYMTLVQLPLGLVPALADWHTPGSADWLLIIVVGVTGLTAHYCMAKALALADATVVVPLDFLRLPLIALVGFAFYAEPLDAFVLAGAAVMLLGNYVSLRAERKRSESVPR